MLTYIGGRPSESLVCEKSDDLLFCTREEGKTSVIHKVFSFLRNIRTEMCRKLRSPSSTERYLRTFHQKKAPEMFSVKRFQHFFLCHVENCSQKNSTELMEFVLSISCSSLPSFSTILFWIFHHNLDFISFIVVHAYIYIKPYSYIEERFPFTASYIGADMTTAPFRGCWNCL